MSGICLIWLQLIFAVSSEMHRRCMTFLVSLSVDVIKACAAIWWPRFGLFARRMIVTF